ncbi:MAG TPA: CD225/dispanin family protein [Fermentimonas sp.]|nr:CD225/dispanin family protein [Fermentimonas sp.]
MEDQNYRPSMEDDSDTKNTSFSDENSNFSTIPPEPPTDNMSSSNLNRDTQNDDIPPLKPANWLWQSIVATILCCLPFGIVGIIYAARVDSLYYNRKYSEAENSARKAKTWTLIAVALGFLYLIIWSILLSTGNMPGYLENIIENNASGYNF